MSEEAAKAKHSKTAEELKQELDASAARLDAQRNEVGQILLSHMSKRPVAVLVVSLSELGFECHISGFNDVGHAMMARQFAQKAADQVFENFLLQNKRQQGPTPPESVL